MTFEPFPKMARLFRDCVVSEKIDGSNAQILVVDTTQIHEFDVPDDRGAVYTDERYMLFAGSRSRWITPGKVTDNYGFAGWVYDNAQELTKLGEGRHFGEWWGKGIQRNYGLNEKRFSLFNRHRWGQMGDAFAAGHDVPAWPKCCHVVPQLYRGPFTSETIKYAIESLRRNGSVAAPGFMKAEGVVTWHEAARQLFKTTLEKDETPKGLAA